MLILGLHSFTHDASAAIVMDGKVVAAAEEERFNRIKHSDRFPENAIRFCLREAGVELKDVDAIAVAWDPFLDIGKKIWCTLANMPGSIKSFIPARDKHIMGNFELWLSYVTLKRTFRKHFGTPVPPLHYLPHHVCHAASAFLAGPFEDAAIITLDASGEWITTFTGEGLPDGAIRKIGDVPFPHSLGCFYGAITQYLGFREKCDEGKVMAMASMAGPEKYIEEFRRVVISEGESYKLDLSYFNHQYDSKRNWYSAKLPRAIGPGRNPSAIGVNDPPEQRHFEIAASAQLRLEEVALEMVSSLHKTTGRKKLCLAGGVALNSVMNARILKDGPFEDVFIHPAANDGGASLGAAILLEHNLTGKRIAKPLLHPYLGPAYGEKEIEKALESRGLKPSRPADLPGETARLVADGIVVGFFQGRMEWGPRALGARSLIADPRRPDMKDRLNKKVKFREPFRPFAPSILEDKVADWFVEGWKSPFMLLVENAKPQMQDRIPSALHVDMTGRVQTVSPANGGVFHAVISEFEKLTGVPLVINTSFNIKGEPIVCSPDDAISCFLNTGIDALAIGPFVVVKESKEHL